MNEESPDIFLFGFAESTLFIQAENVNPPNPCGCVALMYISNLSANVQAPLTLTSTAQVQLYLGYFECL